MSTERVAAEIVLPSGRFARIRVLTGRDYFAALTAMTGGHDMTIYLTCAATTIDGEPLTADMLMDMDIRDVSAIVGVVSKYISSPVKA